MRVLIISQNEKLSSSLSNLIKKLRLQPDELRICNSISEGKKYLAVQDSPDLIFNICELEADKFFEIYQNTQISSVLVFLAGNDRFMATSFLFNTLNFLIEEPTLEDVKFCFDKYRAYHKNSSEVNYVKDLKKLTDLLTQREKDYKKRFMVKIGNVIKSVNVDDIAYFYSHERINFIVQHNAKKFPIDNTLDEVEEILDPNSFFRANRQFIIHINAIAEIHPYFKGRVKLNLIPKQDSELVISAEKSRSFKDWLDE